MKIQTKYHGETEISQEDIISFSNGIPGFESEKEFVLLGFPDNNVFYTLQSVSTPDLSFVVTDPFSFFIDYNVKIDDATIDALAIEKEEDVKLLNILTVRDPFEETTVNLQAPLVINKKKHKGRQVILIGTPYETRHNLSQAREA
ncbi:flagellar assembly protein FliW [Domibacillus sp. PGB-M46]|uniref:flagellar assembly protein FliW n=1 Tax=Domibacillus sp. PGB-M46 TaxID=2910255 RepID=UPI001F598148|nr:flagellar assembly protein FliW [Domibacillus sp. PGB-M46]MCI2253002.1 flagellar assembly protein FliW [Domibacillus sp. PGB-M46]